jgi:hypothetical protein
MTHPDPSALERPLKAAYIIQVVDNITTGEPWAVIETVGSNPAAPLNQLVVPARLADRIVGLINQAHAQLREAIDACAIDDPSWREHARRIGVTLAELHRVGASGHRGQRALAYYDRQRKAGRQHSTKLLEEAAKHGPIGKRRLEQLLQERNNPK